MAHQDMVDLNDGTFEAQATKATLPVIVDFWAPWCGPCKMLTPIIEDLAGDYKGKAVFAKVNVDDSPKVATQFSIISIPTVLFMKNGSVMEQQVGLLAKPALKAKIEAFLKR
jgi:thioredoxin 1